GDPETMSIRSSFPKFVQLEEEHGSLIRGMLKRMAQMKKAPRPAPAGGQKKITMFMTLSGGLFEMIDTLRKLLLASGNTEIRTGVAVTGVTRNGGGYEVGVAKGPSVKADAVIIAAPAYAAASLLRGIDPWISDRLSAIPYVSTATVSIAFKKSGIKHPLNGFGFVVPRTEKRKIMAATWTSVKFSGRAPEDSVLIRCFIGGSKNAELVEKSDEEMVRMVREELKDIMGIEAEPVLTRVFKWKNSMPQYTIGHDERIAAIEEKLSGYPGLYLAGSAYHGIGIADSVRFSEVVAKKALHHIGA
ncbi:MAG: protoporphyrinogen oxidase, partial [Deltaproteobacteria bacterium]|nr:protoporphyrinogen oxidase [Deltaproteobacteria bacterium]